MMVMAQSTLDRIWNRLVDRYNQDDEADCCGPTIEEDQSDSAESESEPCCE